MFYWKTKKGILLFKLTLNNSLLIRIKKYTYLLEKLINSLKTNKLPNKILKIYFNSDVKYINHCVYKYSTVKIWIYTIILIGTIFLLLLIYFIYFFINKLKKCTLFCLCWSCLSIKILNLK